MSEIRYLVFVFIFCSGIALGQQKTTIHFPDFQENHGMNNYEHKPILIINDIADSYTINLDSVKKEWGFATLILNFKYEGHDTINITGSWTSDPHYICDFPRRIIPEKPFQMKFCFSFGGRIGVFEKTMGLNFSGYQFSKMDIRPLTFLFVGVGH